MHFNVDAKIDSKVIATRVIKVLPEIIEGVCGIRPLVTSDAMSISPCHSQLNTRKFGRRTANLSEVT